MKFYKKILIVFIFLFLFYLLFFKVSAHEESLSNLNFEIHILENGDVKISEIWFANMYDTNTLFKTFPNDEKYDEITDVTVYEIDSSSTIIKQFTQSYEYNYYVDEGYFQAITNPENSFEIAWGVNADGNKNSIYRINYTVKNCINVYNDIAEFYWQILGNDWALETDKVSGMLYLPGNVENIEEFRVWAHGPLNGTIEKMNNSTCTFVVSNMPIKTFLELRIAFPKELVPNSTRIYNKEYLSNIISEEEINAERANNIRLKAQRTQKIYSGITYLIELLITFGIFKSLYNTLKSLKDVQYVKPTNKLSYFRDIPNSDVSPVTAHMLINSKNSFTIKSMPNCISSLIMSLTQKGFISVEPGQSKNDTTISITNLDENTKESFTTDEKKLYNYLGCIGQKFTLKQFNKYINSHQESFYNLLEYIKNENKRVLDSSQYTNATNKKAKSSLINYSTLLFILSFSLVFISLLLVAYGLNINYLFVLVLFIILLLGSVYCFIKSKRIPIFSQTGIDEKEEWIGLKKFMTDFSLLKEREIPELVLWEKYLVYATAFGIADKVLKQLKTKFPELNDENYIRDHYTCMYMASHPHIYHNSFSKSVSSAQSYHSAQVAASAMSSGSGGGGGFSSGGGGRRPAEVAAVAVKNNKYKGQC